MTDTCASLSPYGVVETQILEERHNLTALRTIQAPSWVSSPEVRGTSSILWSCIVTIFACIYTALHLNVPTQTKWNRLLLTKTKWVICGLLAPEIVLYLAVSQFIEAWRLVKKLNGLVKQKRDVEAGTGQSDSMDVGEPADQLRDSEDGTGQHDGIQVGGPVDQPRDASSKKATESIIEPTADSWAKSARDNALERSKADSISSSKKQGKDPHPHFNLRYGFFVVMGGLEVSVDDIEDHNESKSRGKPGSGRLRLSLKGVLQLAKHGHFLPIPLSRITDKSKADTLQKVLVMTQVLWMATTCIARKIYGLPLTLLEIHTLVHVFCAAVLYAFWLEKPKDVQDPELLDSSGYANLIALMYTETFVSGNVLGNVILYPKQNDARVPPPVLEKLSGTTSVEKVFLKDDSGNQRHVEWVKAEDSGPEGHCLKIGQAFTFGVGTSYQPPSRYPAYRGPYPNQFSKHSIERWKRARTAVEDISGSIEEPEFFQINGNLRYSHEHYHKAFVKSLGNLGADSITEPWDLVDIFFDKGLLLAISTVLPIAYGGIHLAAREFEFPSGVERLLWNISAIYVMAALPVLLLMVAFQLYITKGSYIELLDRLVSCVIILVLSFYILARLFLVVESFIGLRVAPIGVYWTPAWIQMIPHV